MNSVDARNQHIEALRSSLAVFAHEGGESHSHALIDVEEFLIDFYYNRKVRTTNGKWIASDDKSRPNFCLQIKCEKDEKEVDGKIYFYGKGWWKYHISVADKNTNALYEHMVSNPIKEGEQHDIPYDCIPSTSIYSYQGEGTRWKNSIKDDECNHIFSFFEEVESFFCIEEKFNMVPVKMYSIQSGLRNWPEQVSVGWHLGYYDGPLSGFCYLHHKLHYFHMIEEQDFSGKRLYALHPLSLIDKIRAYGLHFLWEQRIRYNRIKLYDTFRVIFFPKRKYDSKESIGACSN